MVEFRWKTEGTRCAGDVVHLPAAFYLMLIVAVAVALTTIMTGKVSEQERAFQAKQQALEIEMNSKHNVVCLKRDIPAGWTITAADIETLKFRGPLPVDALSDLKEAIGKKTKCAFAPADLVCQHQIYLQK